MRLARLHGNGRENSRAEQKEQRLEETVGLKKFTSPKVITRKVQSEVKVEANGKLNSQASKISEKGCRDSFLNEEAFYLGEKKTALIRVERTKQSNWLMPSG
ncbi:hypothetical protein NDU88_005063 [Pleurodeles waltl]|uniref:Uncharacterized protein n=1 Tax=Pleurodeles waltl TaxID=8319 RepID=A0AAV7TSZ3_PLEWA|nr:hypothetical protein NDU88_005063 [Pleurodeles waltl]